MAIAKYLLPGPWVAEGCSRRYIGGSSSPWARRALPSPCLGTGGQRLGGQLLPATRSILWLLEGSLLVLVRCDAICCDAMRCDAICCGATAG